VVLLCKNVSADSYESHELYISPDTLSEIKM
jgi:hypothetical protein